MGEVSYQLLEDNRDEGYRVYLWEGLTNTDTGAPLHLGGWADRTVQVMGSFGSGGNCQIQGSLMLSTPTFAVLTDPGLTALDITVASLEHILQQSIWVRPEITGGDGTTDLDVYIMVRRSR